MGERESSSARVWHDLVGAAVFLEELPVTLRDKSVFFDLEPTRETFLSARIIQRKKQRLMSH